jgi:hypothetical protein
LQPRAPIVKSRLEKIVREQTGSATENRIDDDRPIVGTGGRERREQTARHRGFKVEEGHRQKAVIFDSGRIFLIESRLVEALEETFAWGREMGGAENREETHLALSPNGPRDRSRPEQRGLGSFLSSRRESHQKNREEFRKE